ELGQLPAERVAETRLFVDPQLVQVLESERFTADLIERGAQLLCRPRRPAATGGRLRRIVLRQSPRQADREFVHLLAGYGTENIHRWDPELTRRIMGVVRHFGQ